MEIEIPKKISDKYNFNKPKLKSDDSPDFDTSKYIVKINQKDLENFEDKDRELSGAMAFAFGLGLSDTARGVQQIAGSEKNYLTGRNMRDEQDELKRLMDEHGFAVTAAYFGGAILDPASWLLPFMKAKTLLKMGQYGMVSGGLAGATGYVDEDSYINTRPLQAGLGLVGGGVLSPTIGALKNLGVTVTGKGKVIPLWEKPMRPMQINYTVKDSAKLGLQKVTLPGKMTEKVTKGKKVIIKSSDRKDIFVRPSKLIEKDLIDANKVTDDFKKDTGFKTILPRIFKDEKGKVVFGRKNIRLGIDEAKARKDGVGGKINLRDDKDLESMILKGKRSKNTFLGGPKIFFNQFIAEPYQEKIGRKLWENVKTGEGAGAFAGSLIGFAGPGVDEETDTITKKLGRAFAYGLLGYAGLKGKFFRNASNEKVKLMDLPMAKFKSPFQSVFKSKVGPDVEDFDVDETLGEFLGRQIVDGFGVPKEVKALKNRSLGEANSLASEFEIQLRNMERLSASELAVVHNLIEGDISAAVVRNRALVKIADDTKDVIQRISQRLVDYGFIKEDVMKRNFNTYLSRVYLDQDRIDIKSISDQLRPRGHIEEVTVDDYLKVKRFEKAYDENNKRVLVKGGMDEPEYIYHRGWELPPGATLEDLQTKAGIQKLIDKGIINKENNTISIRWEMTKPERLGKGEIEDASYAINQTMRMMTSAVGMAKFYNDMAVNYAVKKNQKLYRGLTESQMNKTHGLFKLPTSKIDPKNPNSPFRYGKLAGRYVPREIFVNIVERQRIIEKKNRAFFRGYKTLNQMWKASKTAWNPTVHVNNVFGNVFFTDMADVDFRNLPLAAKMLANHNNLEKEYQSKIIRMAKEHGVFDAGFVDKELRNIDKAGLTQVYKYDFKKDEWTNSVGIAERTFGFIRNNKFTGTLNNYYRIEDHIFRLNAFIDRLQKGYSADEAAMFSRKYFIDYDIDAPLINGLRHTLTPFLAFTYRAVPVLAETAILRPWKYLKYGTMGYLLNRAGEEFGGGDPEVERALLQGDSYKGGKLIGMPFMPYKNIKMPYQTKDGQSKYLFIERYFPGGDIFELGTGAVPILPAPLQPSGGFGGTVFQALVGYDMFTKQPIEGKGISRGRDITAALKSLGKSLIPNFPFVPGSYSTQRINRATVGSKSKYREGESELTAILQTVGIKLNNVSVENLTRSEVLKMEKKIKGLKKELRKLRKKLKDGLITKTEYDGERQDILQEIENYVLNKNLRIDGFDPSLIRESQFVLDLLGQYGIIDKKYADKKYNINILKDL